LHEGIHGTYIAGINKIGFNYLGDFFLQITISGPFVPVATLLRRGTLNLLRKIRLSTEQTITIPHEMIIREFFTRNPDIILLITRDSSRLLSIPYSSIITISYDR
jgi:hypothetical protein